jgi:PhoPQ-activated pathogenicity-related protein
MRRFSAPLAALALLLAAPASARADLDEYLAKPEPAFKWEKRGEESTNGCKVYDLWLVSQEWQGRPWEHRLILVKPDECTNPGFCTLYNTGGKGGKGDIDLATDMAKRSGCCFAIIFQIPNQPLWGKTEDALVVYTWLQFVKSMKADGKGDESWPLHFPMAKAVIKGMDVIQAFAKDASLGAIDSFLVCGGSKRGWTSWLVGASKDPRVKAIAPMVIDTLNVKAQAAYQLASWGKPSEQIMDYTMSGMGKIFQTKEGDRLLELEDPYSYRERLTLPKLIILGTNDRYWTQDALNVYWDGLKGPKWVLYVPNSGHGLEDRGRVMATLAFFARTIAKGQKIPQPRWTYETRQDGGAKLTLESDVPIEEGRLFVNAAPSRDFRDSKNWKFEKMSGEGTKWTDEVDRPKEGSRAIFGEAVYSIDGMRFTLSTQIKILDAPGVESPKIELAPAPPAREQPAAAPKKTRRWF